MLAECELHIVEVCPLPHLLGRMVTSLYMICRRAGEVAVGISKIKPLFCLYLLLNLII